MALVMHVQGGLLPGQDCLKFAEPALLSAEILLLTAAGQLPAAWRLEQSVQEEYQVTGLSANQAC